MAKKSKIGRSAITGRFTSVEKAEKNPNTHVVEKMNKSNKKGK